MTTKGEPKVDVRNPCDARVYGGGWHSYSCSKAATVTRTKTVVVARTVKAYDEEAFAFVERKLDAEPREVVEHFCGTHDPERVARRVAAKDAEWQAERARKAARSSELTQLIARLGCGAPEYVQDKGATGRLVLYKSDVEKLLAELGR